MGVDRLPSGNYRARLMVDGQTCTATFPAQAEADEWLVVTRGRAIEARAARGLTVESYSRQWLGSFVDGADRVEEFRHDVELPPRSPLGGGTGRSRIVDSQELL